MVTQQIAMQKIGVPAAWEVDTYGISWSSVTFAKSTWHGGDEKVILNKVSGHCAPGDMLALMGPSGCGKTSLLDILADRVGSGRIEGEVLIGAHQRDAASSRRICSYVAQEDSLLSCFSVGETLRYAAYFSLASLSSSKREARVREVMEQMGITSCERTRVGDDIIKGISGGQKRRLSIAIELLSSTPILLLDEPTSGLDSSSALAVIVCLKKLASMGRTILMSIHQPSSMIYDKFSSVGLMVRGHMVYFGPTGQRVLNHFTSLGYTCPQFINPAEFFLELINQDFQDKGASSVKSFVDAFPESTAYAEQIAQAKQLDSRNPRHYAAVNRAGPIVQFLVLLLRTLHMSWKNPYIYIVRLVMYIGLSFMVGTMYLGKGTTARNDSSAGGALAAQSLLPLLFYVQAFLVFMSVAILPFFLEIRNVFRRERANGNITCMPYVVANFLANLPGVVTIAIVSTLLVVSVADLNGFGGFFLNLFLSLVVAESLMHFIGAAQPHYIIGMAGGAGLFGMFMLCEGFMLRPADIPAGWKWGYWIAFHHYSFEWFVHNQFSGTQGGTYGQSILDNYGMADVVPWHNALILLFYALCFEIGFFLVLFFVHTGRR